MPLCSRDKSSILFEVHRLDIFQTFWRMSHCPVCIISGIGTRKWAIFITRNLKLVIINVIMIAASSSLMYFWDFCTTTLLHQVIFLSFFHEHIHEHGPLTYMHYLITTLRNFLNFWYIMRLLHSFFFLWGFGGIHACESLLHAS